MVERIIQKWLKMKSVLLGELLNMLLKEYQAGACDNITEEEQQEVFKQLASLHDTLSRKLDKMYTIEEASIYLNVTRQTINNYVKLGKLTPKKQIGGVKQFKQIDLDTLKHKA